MLWDIVADMPQHRISGTSDLSAGPDASWAVVDAAGRLVVPAHFRAALGFAKRQKVHLALDGPSLRLTPAEAAMDAAVDALQALARKHGGGRGGEVEAFIAERRADAAKE